MGIIDSIKKEAERSGARVGADEATRLETILDGMFRCPRKPEDEIKFLTQVMDRGTGDTERKGLHASAQIESEKEWCLRCQVISQFFKQVQDEKFSVNSIRIFEEGNAVHEKWQRLFIRAGYAEPLEQDRTRYSHGFNLSYSPDVICNIPEFYSGLMVGEIKSVNGFQYGRMKRHPKARKQLMLYMFLLRTSSGKAESDPDYGKGFVLCENKDTQEFKCEVYDYDEELVKPFKERLDAIRFATEEFQRTRKPPKRHELCTDSGCRLAETCPMRDACWNIGMGKVRL